MNGRLHRGTFGYLAPDARGELQYVSLLDAVLLKGLQELESENVALRAEVDTLHERAERMAQLEARLTALEGERTDRQHAGWVWPAGILLGLVLAGGLAWRRRVMIVR